MPRENRKRGKKNKKKDDVESHVPEQDNKIAPELPGEPSWIVPNPAATEEVNLEAPFGYVDADVKAYFRTVDVQIRDWQETQVTEVPEDTDPNEQKHLFFVAALTEMAGKEKQLATDPDCSVILERLSYSMDDFVRRVFVDSLAGSYEVLIKHRFASHVCQTLFTVAAETTTREYRGILPTVSDSPEHGELRTLTQLVLDVCSELRPSFSSLIMDPFASHVVRALLLLLSPTSSHSDDNIQSALRSKKSATWKARQGSMKSVFSDDKGKSKMAKRDVIPEFRDAARQFVEVVRTELSENEVRALAANKVASPGLQMLLEVEANQNMAKDPGSLMDRVMVGIITACRDDPSPSVEPSDYLNTLLRDPTSSHLLETIVTYSPDDAFAVLWSTYFSGKLARLAAHPVANFVIAKAIERATASQLSNACVELEGAWGKLVKTSRTGVLRAIIDRASTIHNSEQEICEAICTAFEIVTAEDRAFIVPCVLYMLSPEDYKSSIIAPNDHATKPDRQKNESKEQKTQGAVLLQSLLKVDEPHNQFVIDSINSLPMDQLLQIAHNATGSRVLDALLESSTVPMKAKRQFVMSLIGHYHLLVDDRIGSRVGDRCWAFADTYLKEKIARSLIPHEQFLAGSYYGKFFARNLNLYLLQRRPQDWRNMQVDRKRAQDEAAAPHSSIKPTSSSAVPTGEQPKKRKRPVDNEIDAVFNANLGKKIKKAALLTNDVPPTTKILSAETAGTKSKKEQSGNNELQDVLGAIRAAPKDEKKRKKRH